jgi:Lar family restriction alleviation protein
MSETTDIDAMVRNCVHNLQDDGTPYVYNPYPYIPDELETEPCPFCGGEASNFWNDHDKAEPSWVVTCGSCVANGPPGETLTEAYNAWNNRS